MTWPAAVAVGLALLLYLRAPIDLLRIVSGRSAWSTTSSSFSSQAGGSGGG
jgi:hypothetical protein